MKVPLKVRLALDLSMTGALLFALAFRITGDFAHEWIGLAAALLFALHNAVNCGWYARLLSGKYGARRIANASVDFALAADALLVAATGFMQSKYILAFLELPGSMELRQIHATAAYWMPVLAAIHLGMHWEMVLGAMGLNKNAASNMRAAALRIFGIAAAACGVWASFERGMFSKLFLGYSFDFWDPESPPILFFLANAAIMALWAFVAHYALKAAGRIGKFRQKQRENPQ